VRNWQEWFAPPAENDNPADTEQARLDALRVQSGSGHRDENFKRPEVVRTPRCVSCQEAMDYNDGMHIMISTDWKLHISCFYSVIERHFEEGEVIDLTTGNVHKIDDQL
jgi:hypothetical protein